MRLLLTLAVLCSFSTSQLVAQDSVTVVPAPEYEAGGLHKLFFGSGWRDLWTTPISAEPIEPSLVAGGLKNDGHVLQFRGSNGKQILFRPFSAEAEFAAPAQIRRIFTDSLAQDFIASTFPVPELITSPLLTAVGLAGFPYRIVLLPNTSPFGPFADAVGILEERPATDGDKLITTEELLARLDRDSREHVEADEYLKARLMDIYFGDWNRPMTSYEWWATKNTGGTTYRVPIHRAQFQAFSRYGGLAGWRLTQEVPEIESFSDSYPWISDLTWSGRALDRRLLSGLARAEWDIVTNDLLTRLNDEAIEAAVREIPPAMYEKQGENLVRMLKARRDKLKEAAEAYYEHLARFVDIHTSDMNEYADVERIGDDTVIVSLYKRERGTGGATGQPFFSRTFDRKETREIRVYLQGGDDFTVVRGNAMHSIPVRIIGGDGDDELADSSQVQGKFLGIISVPKTGTYFYESDRKAEFIYGPSTKALTDDAELSDSLMALPDYRDWGHAWKAFPWVGLNSDDGLFLGAKANLTYYGFRTYPYRDRASFSLGYAFGPNKFRAVIEHAFANTLGGTINLYAHASTLETVNFFGYGNNTTYSSELAKADAYKVQRFEATLLPGYSIKLLEKVTIKGYAGIRITSTDTSYTTTEEARKGIVLRVEKPYGLEDGLYSAFGVSGTYDSRDNSIATQNGVYFALGTRWSPEIFDTKYAYTKAYSEFRGFYTAPVLSGITLAVRARGEKLFGNRFPYYAASFLGGINDLRGYARERFAGDAAMLATAELRIGLAEYSIVTPGRFGVHLFAEEGRVFYDGETSEARHGSFGGGIWLAPVSVENTVALTFARSPEQLTFALTGGFAF